MKEEDIIPWDWQRILIGEVPIGFLPEAVLRIGFIYILLLLSMRILGKKMASQFTRNEMAALVSLAAAVGIPILTPDRGLLPALAICIAIVSVSRLVLYFSMKTEKMESLALGSAELLIDDGVMRIKTLASVGLSKERVFAQLRSQQIIHLGEVSRLYFEASGKFTLVRAANKKPGLVVLPEQDENFISGLTKAQKLTCDVCGYLNHDSNKNLKCPSCGHRHWRLAVTSAEKSPEKVAMVQQ